MSRRFYITNIYEYTFGALYIWKTLYLTSGQFQRKQNNFSDEFSSPFWVAIINNSLK